MLRINKGKDYELLPKKVIDCFKLMKMPPREASFV